MPARGESWSRHVHVEPGGLHGWCARCDEASRHEALRRSVHADGYATTVRRLNFIVNVGNRRTDEHARRIAHEDERWLERMHREGMGED